MPLARLTARAASLVLVALAVSAPGASWADDVPPDETRTWALVPSSAEAPDGRGRFEYTVEPGQTITDHVAVRNLGTEPLTLDVYAQDAASTPTSPFELLTPDEEALRVGAWTHLAEPTVTVPARGVVVIPFALDVPDDAEPGDHAGGIVAVSTVDDVADAALQYRVGTRVYVRVAGTATPALDVDHLEGHYRGRLSPVASGTLAITATVVNTGNVRLVPTATAHVRSLFGIWEAEVALDEVGELLPGGAATTTGELASAPPLGPLWVTVEFDDVTSRDQDVTDAVHVTTRTVRVWATPWVALATVACLAIAAVIGARGLRRRRRLRRTPTAPPGDARPQSPAQTLSRR